MSVNKGFTRVVVGSFFFFVFQFGFFLLILHPGEGLFSSFQRVMTLKPFVLFIAVLFLHLFDLLALKPELEVHVVDVKFLVADWDAVWEETFGQGVGLGVIGFGLLWGFRELGVWVLGFELFAATVALAFLTFFFLVGLETLVFIVGETDLWLTFWGFADDDASVVFDFQSVEEGQFFFGDWVAQSELLGHFFLNLAADWWRR